MTQSILICAESFGMLRLQPYANSDKKGCLEIYLLGVLNNAPQA